MIFFEKEIMNGPDRKYFFVNSISLIVENKLQRSAENNPMI